MKSGVVPPQLTAALAERYTIERELGRGGMAVVYLARDLKHDRQVALKVVQPSLAETVKAERFLREIQIAAKLTHPHILGLYDSGAAGGFLYYVMPYVEGESLRNRLIREHQLPVDEALRITRDVASALGEAHAQSVVHRDIKPENILLTKSGHAVVADFGIARALTVTAGAEAGLVAGTASYMSPEQGAGSEVIDGRSDLYSLGCVLYEMLTGHPPYAGETAQEILARHTLDPIPTVRAARPGVPRAVERAVAKALAKVPADRFATATAFAGALTAPRRRVAAYVAAGLVVMIAGAVVARQTVLRQPSERSVAVLAFVNLSAQPESSEYFSDGLTEELINALAQVPSLRVPAATSAFALKGRSLSVRQIADTLHVATVLEGSVRRAGSGVRITAQLINAADGYHLWSSSYDREIHGVRDVLAIQNEIARAIVGALRIKLRGGDATPLVPRSTDDAEAYNLYLRGRYFLARRTRAGDQKAIESFTRAIERDPTYARAYAGLADAYLVAGNGNFMDPDVAFLRAKAAALHALALDSTLAEPHASLARLYTNYEWDLAEAERLYRRAIALNPAYAQAHSWYGNWLLGPTGRFTEAIREARTGVELDPLAPYMYNNLGWVLVWARRYDEAIDQLRGASEAVPDWGGPHQFLARTYRAKGMLQQAMAEYQTVRRLNPNSSLAMLPQIGSLYAATGRRSEAMEILEQLQGRPGRDLLGIADLYLALGERDSALAALERAFAQRPSKLRYLKVDPIWDPLRGEPRFRTLLRKLGLEP